MASSESINFAFLTGGFLNLSSSVLNASCNGTSNESCMDLTATTDNKGVAPEKFYWALLLIPFPLLAVAGNILVILSVYREKNLQNVTNYFIVSLAFADMVVAAVAMPFAVYVIVNVDWELSNTLCDFYIAVDVTCSTASIFNLVAISIDRYIAVTKPISYSKHRSNKRVFVTIAVVWVVSAAIGSPIVLGLNTSPERTDNLCVFYNSDFIIYSSLSSFYIPCLVMVFLYYKIFRAIHERAVQYKRRHKALANKLPTEGTKDSPLQHQPIQAQLHVVVETEMVAKINHTEDEPAKEEGSPAKGAPNHPESVVFKFKSRHHSDSGANGDSGYDGPSQQDAHAGVKTDSPLSVDSPGGSPRVDNAKKNGILAKTGTDAKDGEEVVMVKKKKYRFNLRKKHKSCDKKREKASAKRERKATKTLAIVLGMFLMCWVPFFTCNILDAICIKLDSDTWRPGVNVFLITTWLGYINSCVNPVIYTIFNIEFRKAFKKILQRMCTGCSGKNRSDTAH